MTLRTVHSQMVTPFGFTLEERTPMFHKFLLTRLGLKLGCQLAILFFKLGIFSLKLFYLFRESLHLVPQKLDPLLQDGGASVFGDDLIEESGNVSRSHESESKTVLPASKLET